MKPFLLISLFCAAICAGCHKSNQTLNHSHPLVPGPGSWRWIKEDWYFLQNSGVITPSPDSLTLLQINTDLSYDLWVWGKLPTRVGTYKNDITKESNPGIPLIDSFYTFDKVVNLGSGASLPLQKLHHWINRDTLYLQTELTPAGANIYYFVRYN